MNGDAADIVRVRLEQVDTLQGVVVVDADGHVVGSRHDPVLTGDELGGPDGEVAHLEGLDQGLVFVVPDVDVSVVEGGHHPGLRGVEVAAFHAVTPRRQPTLDVQAERLKRNPKLMTWT